MHREQVRFGSNSTHKEKKVDRVRRTICAAREIPFSLEVSEKLSWDELIGRSDCAPPSGRKRVNGPYLIDDLLHRLESEAWTRSE